MFRSPPPPVVRRDLVRRWVVWFSPRRRVVRMEKEKGTLITKKTYQNSTRERPRLVCGDPIRFFFVGGVDVEDCCGAIYVDSHRVLRRVFPLPMAPPPSSPEQERERFRPFPSLISLHPLLPFFSRLGFLSPRHRAVSLPLPLPHRPLVEKR